MAKRIKLTKNKIIMGDIADYYADLAMQVEFELQQIDEYYNNIHFNDLLKEYVKGKLHWVTKDGQQILIKNMTDSHLLNSIKWLNKIKQYTWVSEMKDILIMEKEKRKL